MQHGDGSGVGIKGVENQEPTKSTFEMACEGKGIRFSKLDTSNDEEEKESTPAGSSMMSDTMGETHSKDETPARPNSSFESVCQSSGVRFSKPEEGESGLAKRYVLLVKAEN